MKREWGEGGEGRIGASGRGFGEGMRWEGCT